MVSRRKLAHLKKLEEQAGDAVDLFVEMKDNYDFHCADEQEVEIAHKWFEACNQAHVLQMYFMR